MSSNSVFSVATSNGGLSSSSSSNFESTLPCPVYVFVLVNCITVIAFMSLATYANYCMQLRQDQLRFEQKLRHLRAVPNRVASYNKALYDTYVNDTTPPVSRGANGPPSSSLLNTPLLGASRLRSASYRSGVSYMEGSVPIFNNESFGLPPQSQPALKPETILHFSDSDDEDGAESVATEKLVREQQQRDEQFPLIDDAKQVSNRSLGDEYDFDSSLDERAAGVYLSKQKLSELEVSGPLTENTDEPSEAPSPSWWNVLIFLVCCVSPPKQSRRGRSDDLASRIHESRFSWCFTSSSTLLRDERNLFFIMVIISCIAQATTLLLFTFATVSSASMDGDRQEQDEITSFQAFTVFATFAILLVVLHSLINQELNPDQQERIRWTSRLIMISSTIFIFSCFFGVNLILGFGLISPIASEFVGTAFSITLSFLFALSAYILPKKISVFSQNSTAATVNKLRLVCLLCSGWMLVRFIAYFPFLQTEYASLSVFAETAFDFVDMSALAMSLWLLHTR